MAADETLTRRVRTALQDISPVEEKRMFGGLVFMVDGKMCVCVDAARLMVRIDPAVEESALARIGCHRVEMNGRSLRGYVYVDAAAVAEQQEFDYWMDLALTYNPKAKPAVRRGRR
jgi:TfoX/Sxy family transcriptional regulator of competence genes